MWITYYHANGRTWGVKPGQSHSKAWHEALAAS